MGAFLAVGMTPLATAPAAHADLFDFDWLDPSVFSGLTEGLALPAASGGGPLADLLAEVAPLYHDDFYLPVHAGMEDFLNAAINQPLLAAINTPYILLFGRDLIGNGIDGFDQANISLFGTSGLFG
ncbi:MAG: hypothetical protein ACRDU4_11420, partial [Mycobacterium sp.]